MCLVTKQIVPEILTKDLIVYKKVEQLPIFLTDTDDEIELRVSSSSQGFEYVLGNLYETSISRIDLDSNDLHPGSTAHADDIVGIHYNIKGPCSHAERIEYLKMKRLAIYAKGFHFYKTIKRANDSGIHRDYVLVECTIPKGSQVYYDETKLGVANKIIINKILPTYIDLNA